MLGTQWQAEGSPSLPEGDMSGALLTTAGRESRSPIWGEAAEESHRENGIGLRVSTWVHYYRHHLASSLPPGGEDRRDVTTALWMTHPMLEKLGCPWP